MQNIKGLRLNCFVLLSGLSGCSRWSGIQRSEGRKRWHGSDWSTRAAREVRTCGKFTLEHLIPRLWGIIFKAWIFVGLKILRISNYLIFSCRVQKVSLLWVLQALLVRLVCQELLGLDDMVPEGPPALLDHQDPHLHMNLVWINEKYRCFTFYLEKILTNQCPHDEVHCLLSHQLSVFLALLVLLGHQEPQDMATQYDTYVPLRKFV